jgi:hypothetical protein
MSVATGGGTRKFLGVVGLGPAGCIFLASLPSAALTPNTVVYDSGCIGGDLARLYGCVTANLTCAEIVGMLRMVSAWKDADMAYLTDRYAPDKCPMLSDACAMIRQLVAPILAKVTVRTVHVHEIKQLGDGWFVSTGNGTETFGKVVLCTGASPIQLDIPKSNIPLDIALCEEKLRSFVRPTDRVVVFGTAHSGTLVLRNLKNVGVSNVTAVHKNEKPFSWARDGDTEGIKQESAVIADEIVGGAWGPMTPSLVRLDTATCGFLRSILECDHVIYGIGFQTRAPVILDSVGAKIDVATYNVESAQLRDGLWGFGIGFPSKYTTPTGRQASDVGFGPFAAHIAKCLPAILGS